LHQYILNVSFDPVMLHATSNIVATGFFSLVRTVRCLAAGSDVLAAPFFFYRKLVYLFTSTWSLGLQTDMDTATLGVFFVI